MYSVRERKKDVGTSEGEGRNLILRPLIAHACSVVPSGNRQVKESEHSVA